MKRSLSLVIALMLLCSCSSAPDSSLPSTSESAQNGVVDTPVPDVDPYKEDYLTALDLCSQGKLDNAFAIFDVLPDDYGDIQTIKNSVEPYREYIGKWYSSASDFFGDYMEYELDPSDIHFYYINIQIAYDSGSVSLIYEEYPTVHAVHPSEVHTYYLNAANVFELPINVDENGVGDYNYIYMKNGKLHKNIDALTIMYSRYEPLA